MNLLILLKLSGKVYLIYQTPPLKFKSFMFFFTIKTIHYATAITKEHP